MNVLLIYPKFPDTFWSFKYALNFVHRKAANPPLGLLTVAAMLPNEFQKRLVDVNVNNLTDEDLSWADMAFIGESGIVTAMVGLLNAPPGTRLYERMKKEGRLTSLITGDNVEHDLMQLMYGEVIASKANAT